MNDDVLSSRIPLNASSIYCCSQNSYKSTYNSDAKTDSCINQAKPCYKHVFEWKESEDNFLSELKDFHELSSHFSKDSTSLLPLRKHQRCACWAKTSFDIEDIEEFDEKKEESHILPSDLYILSNFDYTLVMKKHDLLSFEDCLSEKGTSFFFFNLFEATAPFHRFTFSLSAMKMLSLENAGGSSDKSEAVSFDVLHRLFSAKLEKAEMEIKYINQNWKKTDYLCTIAGHRLGVSVTRAVGHPRPEDFTEEMAVSLMQKKLFGIRVSSLGVGDGDKWERQVLHIWSQSVNEGVMLLKAYQCLHPGLRGDTIVICSIAGNLKWLFTGRKEDEDW
ncbi:putative Signal transducing adapter molecule 2 [Monocercomonoides exilis]|uniref:putative Signal transducing adapter molecule 2 n=1 Tax=Monocercomonoides exilis TaxID=2049356 RepID=UPI00355997B7|nr:putative Signal transducing adapter molecule 2 [Monocercomonoides exilis]|eukprot:MONOS_13259.1-p1 / transcript=MONOS_13259.1 / gene=MONOS_13259 / organism=Monocercomonoides_exilis_PA203 / gene_product=Signal transducing adapter molecule 2 / transcript_product=Signal transducing adapter molecule 2 / location=Mono_scaffold00799:10795-12174(+) / protein_length=332 / sequence_SO=supercontig / SO=protein_coding / is_pseudo=false